MFRFASSLTPAICEVQTTVSRLRRGWSTGVGSSSQTSSPAALILPRVRPSKRARSSCVLPRQVLTKTTPAFIFAMVSALMMCCVSVVSGVCTVITSDCVRSWSSETGSVSRLRSSSGATYGSQPSTRMPNARAM